MYTLTKHQILIIDIDEISHYKLHIGILGKLVNSFLVGRQLLRVFDCRSKYLRRCFMARKKSPTITQGF